LGLLTAILLLAPPQARSATSFTWFKASAITGLTNGATIASWTDLTGNGYHATQSTASKQPFYITNVMNGKPVVRFVNSNNTSLAFSRSIQDDFTILWAFRSTQGLNSGTLYYQGAGLINAEMPGGVNDFGACLFANGAICAGTGNPDVAIKSASGYNDGKPHVAAFHRVKATGQVSLYVDGALAGTTTGSTASLTAPNRIVLGAQQTSMYYLSGDLAEVQLFTNALSASELLAAQSNLFLDYGLSPAAPPTFSIQRRTNQFNLTWGASAGATGYRVKRGAVQAGPFTNLLATNAFACTDSSASPASTWFYLITATNLYGESGNSVILSTADIQSIPAFVWFKADSITGVTNGGSVSSWPNSTGTGYNAAQTTVAKQPAWVTNGINGKPAVHFNNAGSTSLAFSRPVQDDFTIVCLFQTTQGLNSGTDYYGGAGLVNGEVGGVENDFGACIFADGSLAAGTGNPDVSIDTLAGYNDGKPHLMTFQRTRASGQTRLFMDGSLAGTATGGTNSLTAPSRLTLGSQQTDIYFFSGDIAETQLFTNVLSDADRTTVETELFQKYGLPPAIPSGLYLQFQAGLPILTWQDASGATRYYIQRATSADGAYTTISTNSGTSFTDSSATSTNLYFYRVIAVNANGQSSASLITDTDALLDPHEKLGPSSRATPIVISEIMWKPADRTDARNLEYIEIYNSNPWSQDIGGYRLVCADMTYTFPTNTTIGSNAFLVVAAAPADITAVYGITNVVGPYTGSLKRAETLQLLDEQNSVLLTVPYSTASPWPVATDSTGHSLVLANPTYGEADPRAWDISDVAGGSPGQPEVFHPHPLRSVVINEFLAHSEASSAAQFIELYNHSTAAVDLTGCLLTDDPATTKFIVPPGTTIPASGFAVFSQTQLGFTLNAAGGTLYLIKPDGSRILDAAPYGAQADGVAYGRWPDGANDFYSFTTNTPGTNNAPILIGDIVINELMYHPLSENDDDQFIELFNKGTNSVNLAGWQFTSGVSFTFPSVSLAPQGYLVVARNLTNLLAKHPGLTTANTVGNFGGKLSHNGELVVLAQPKSLYGTNAIYVEADRVAYGTDGRWGEWSDGGGSSLELVDPNANHRLAVNWADSDESAKSTWTNLTVTGVLDNGYNYSSSIGYAQVGLTDVGEALVDQVSIVPAGSTNLVLNPGFELGTLDNWSLQGDHSRSSLESSGYQGNYSLHVRASDGIFNGVNSCQMVLGGNSLASGQTATLSLTARWLRGWPEILLRLNGGWLEATSLLPVPQNLGTPGDANSRARTHAAPAIFNVSHTPATPAQNQPLLVVAQAASSATIASLVLCYRLDPATNYLSVPMRDDGSAGDAIAHDGVWSATIPGQASGQVVAFYITATDQLDASSRFPELRAQNNEPIRECVAMFGDGNPGGSFGVYHLCLTRTNITRWANLGNISNEEIDGTMVQGKRVFYNMQARFAGSPVHQYFDTPNGTWCSYKFSFNKDDRFLGATAFNKIHWPGNTDNDPTLQREQLANTFLRALGMPWLNRRYVVLYVNGSRRGSLMEDAQTPNSDMVKQYFPSDTDGRLYKLARWFEFAPYLSGYSVTIAQASEALILPFTTTGGAKKAARYRWNFQNRRTPDTTGNYTNLFSLIDAASDHSNPDFAHNLNSLANMDNWMRVFAANHAAGNWDCFGCESGQNLYAYVGAADTRWTLMMFDFNIGLGIDRSYSPGQNLFTTLDTDTNITAIYNEPAFRRMYWRALQELCDSGPLSLSRSVPMLNAKYLVFAANGLSAEDPNANLIPWITEASASIQAQVAAADAAAFSTNASLLITNGTVQITGQAPFQIDTILVNGAAYPVTWTSITSWSILVPLSNGTNTLNLVGVTRSGNAVSGASATVSVSYTNRLDTPTGSLVINEILAAPDSPRTQFIELYNTSTNTTFDLSGWLLGGLNYTFPAGAIIKPANYLVLAANTTAFADAHGATIAVFDTFSNALGSGGQTLALIQTGVTNTTVTQVPFRTTRPWPTNASQNGVSLQLIDASRDNWRAGNWDTAIAAPFATPGARNSGSSSLSAFQPLWLNELEASNLSGITNRAEQRAPWLEIYNPSPTNVSLHGLYLANNYTNLAQWPFPTNASIAPGEFKVVFADGLTNLSTTNELHTSFVLPAGTGALALCRIGSDSRAQVLDYVDYSSLGTNRSYGSLPDGQSFQRRVFYTPTPGTTNNGSTVQPPSYIVYSVPGMVYSQNFNSLPNPGATSVNTDNPVTINGIAYSLANPFDFAFPQSSVTAGGLGLSSLEGWYGYAALGSKFGATTGDQTTGGDLSFGLPSSDNRALGLLATSSTGATAFAVKFINATGTNLNYLKVACTGELWRQSDVAKTLQTYYTIDPTATNLWPGTPTGYLTGLNVNFPTSSAAKGGVAADGTAAINQTSLTIFNQPIAVWPPGAALWLVWQMASPTGKAQGLAVDNLAFSAFSTPLTSLGSMTLSIGTGTANISWPTVPGGTYRLQYKNALSDAQWITLGSDLPGTGEPLSRTLDTAAQPQRFYRVLLVN
jgi:hypothetical protein